MAETGPRIRNEDRWTLILTVGFVTTLAVVYVVDRPELWLGWAVVTVVITGAAMVLFNRETPRKL